MCKEYKIAKEIVKEYISKETIFIYDELLENIKKSGGVLRIAPKYTIKQYLDFYESKSIIKYIPKNDEYIRGINSNG